MKSSGFFTTVAILTIFSTTCSFSQDNFGDLLHEEVGESKILMGEYIAPLMKATSLGLNQGWYNTAKPHKTLGFDLTVSVSGMKIPDSDKFFNVENLGLTHFSLNQDSPDYPNAPTIFGGEREPEYLYRSDPDDPSTEETFTGPPGLDLKENIKTNMWPVPIVNLGIGLPKNTDLKVRFVPSVDIGSNGSFKMWGVGVMHDVKQYIPGIKLLPFDLSGFFGYTKLDLRYSLADNNINGENQRGELGMSATTIQAVVSKKFAVLTIYGGFGYNIARSNLAVRGTYDINDDGDTNDSFEVNPVELDFSASGLRGTAGLRLKLAVITLHADYTLQKYKALNVGFGINVR